VSSRWNRSRRTRDKKLFSQGLDHVDHFSMKIGKTLRELREAAGLTQAALAERSGIHRVHANRLEHDTKSPTLDVFFRLCASLDVLPSAFLALVERVQADEWAVLKAQSGRKGMTDGEHEPA
jgi:transcriptional regulator with XRE-family HTH domain